MTSYYDILGVAPHASLAEIRTAYHRLALKYHPDKNSAPDAAERFIAVQAAWDTLSDAGSRQLYDTQLSATYHPEEEYTETNNERPATSYTHHRPAANTPPHSDPYARQQDVFDEDADPMYDYNQGSNYRSPYWTNFLIIPVFVLFLAFRMCTQETKPKDPTAVGVQVSGDTVLLYQVVNGDTVYAHGDH